MRKVIVLIMLLVLPAVCKAQEVKVTTEEMELLKAQINEKVLYQGDLDNASIKNREEIVGLNHTLTYLRNKLFQEAQKLRDAKKAEQAARDAAVNAQREAEVKAEQDRVKGQMEAIEAEVKEKSAGLK